MGGLKSQKRIAPGIAIPGDQSLGQLSFLHGVPHAHLVAINSFFLVSSSVSFKRSPMIFSDIPLPYISLHQHHSVARATLTSDSRRIVKCHARVIACSPRFLDVTQHFGFIAP